MLSLPLGEVQDITSQTVDFFDLTVGEVAVIKAWNIYEALHVALSITLFFDSPGVSFAAAVEPAALQVDPIILYHATNSMRFVVKVNLPLIDKVLVDNSLELKPGLKDNLL